MTEAIPQSGDIRSQLTSDVERLTRSLGQLPEPMAEPSFIAVSGLPGTGKSYFCSKLAEKLPFVILESDALRRSIFPRPSYSQPEGSRLFRAIHVLIERLLKKGIPIILDATNLAERYREHLYSIAERLNVRLILVRVEAPPEVVHERLKNRPGDPRTKSDADWEVYQKMKRNAQRIQRNHYVVDTSQDITPVVAKIVREASR
jgi:hypothetical protein